MKIDAPAPHLPGLIDAGEANGTPYYVMSLVEDETDRDG